MMNDAYGNNNNNNNLKYNSYDDFSTVIWTNFGLRYSYQYCCNMYTYCTNFFQMVWNWGEVKPKWSIQIPQPEMRRVKQYVYFKKFLFLYHFASINQSEFEIWVEQQCSNIDVI